ncbi:MAG: inorganic phosphate transporter [Bacteroidota bacterium]
MTPIFTILLIPFLLAMFLAVTMGGSGTSPAFSAAYGANIIRKNLIPGLFGIFVFAGAIIAGKQVALTLGKGILAPDAMTLTLTSIIFLSVALSLLIANLLGVPQSTSQSTVFAMSGPAVYLNMLNSKKLFLEIIPTWFILPIIAFILMYLIGKFVYKPLKQIVIIRFDQLSNHPVLKYIVIISSCFVAFAIGANNVANASGPIASMLVNELEIDIKGDKFILVMIISTLIIAPCFGIGSSVFGHKVVKTTGKEIIKIGPLGATIISLLTASLILSASLIRGIPTSLVQLNTAAIIALGVSKVGWNNILRDNTVRKVWIIWIIAPVFALILSLLLTFIADVLGILNY